MISVLIPIYNFEVKELVQSLISQFEDLSLRYEIVLIDDFSENKFKEYNRHLGRLEFVSYEELDYNVGRAKIRNLLIAKAHYEYLLFLDCDSEIHSSNFIQSYINNIEPNIVIHGGSLVSNHNKCPKCSLRWNYESKAYQFYKSFPSKRSFKANNFFTTKKLLSKIQFDECITSYGYEDSVFAIEAKKAGFKVKNILNPVVHVGMDDNQAYLAKIECSILGLYQYYVNAKDKTALVEEIKLLKVVRFLSKTNLIYFAAFLFKTFRQSIKTRLIGKSPKIRHFNFYKIGYFCFLKLQPKKYAK